MIAATVNWGRVGIVLGIVAALALVFAVLILIVTKVCKIKEDETVLKILENLAGANCGGCGHTGCEGFAKSLACGKGCLSDCKATSNEAKAIIAKIAGIPFEAEEPTVAVVKCNGGQNAADRFSYVGNEGCLNRMVYQGGNKICATACLGGGTCASVCGKTYRRTGGESGARDMYFLRSVYYELSEKLYRENTCFGENIRSVQNALQRKGDYGVLQSGVHRMRNVREEMSRRRDNDGGQSSRDRL